MQNVTLVDFLDEVHFEPVLYNKDGTLYIRLIDKLWANLGNIESELFKFNDNIAIDLIERLDIYFVNYVEDLVDEDFKNEGVDVSNMDWNEKLDLYIETHDDPYVFALRHPETINIYCEYKTWKDEYDKE